jgi:hypothetical protein
MEQKSMLKLPNSMTTQFKKHQPKSNGANVCSASNTTTSKNTETTYLFAVHQPVRQVSGAKIRVSNPYCPAVFARS